MLIPHAQDEAGDDAADRRGERTEPDRSGRPGLCVVQPGTQRLDLLPQQRTLVDDPSARGGQHDTATGTVEQARAQIPLQPLDLLRHGGRRESQFGGGGVNRSGAGDREERVDGEEVDHGDSLHPPSS